LPFEENKAVIKYLSLIIIVFSIVVGIYNILHFKKSNQN